MFGCSGTQTYNPEVRDEGSGQPWDTDQASWSSVLRYYLGLEHTFHGQKAEVLPLDHHCLCHEKAWNFKYTWKLKDLATRIKKRKHDARVKMINLFNTECETSKKRITR